MDHLPQAFQVLLLRKVVPVTYESSLDEALVKQVEEFVPFKTWVAKTNKIADNEIHVTRVHIQSIDMFGTKIGFIKFQADVDKNGKFVPGVTFTRGGSVAILVILKSDKDGKEYAVLTVQPRIPIGRDANSEIPAGMLDGSGNFIGIAANELREETGIFIDVHHLTSLTDLAYDTAETDGVYLSPGGCDEFVKLFVHRRIATQEYISQLEGAKRGLISAGELITLHVIPLEDIWKVCPDGKTLCAVLLYEKLLHAGKIPAWKDLPPQEKLDVNATRTTTTSTTSSSSSSKKGGEQPKK